MSVGSDYMYLIEQQATNGNWFPRADLLPTGINKKAAGERLESYRSANCLPADKIRLAKWQRAEVIE